MQIIFYNNQSKNTKLEKNIGAPVATINCNVKHDCDIISPSVIIESSTPVNCNYCYIEKFKRYYYVENITYLIGKRYRYDLRVDVLMSFKEDIKKCNAYIERTESIVLANKYLNDALLPISTKRDVKISNGFGGFSKTLYNYLVVVGGGTQ